MTAVPSALPRGENPFDSSGVNRGADGIARYSDLPRSLVDMLSAHADARPEAEAVAEIGGVRLTYRQLWDRSARVAGGLRELGVTRGDRVALRTPAGVEWVLAFLGSVMAGAAPVPVNTRFAEPEIAYVVADSGSSHVFAAGEPLPDGEPFVEADLGADDLAAIFYTSGTTGFPKGATTTHAGFLSNCENIVRVMGIDRHAASELRTLISVPLFHVTGCNSQLLSMLYVGGFSAVLPALDLAAVLRSISDERINYMVTVPAVYQLLIGRSDFSEHDTSSVRWVGYGGAPIASALVHRLKDAFGEAKVFNGFGMTETASLLTVLPDEFAAEHADSVGFAVPVVDLAVDQPDPQSGVGELLARGPNITAGYWNAPEATAAAIVEGWLHTGDLARVDSAGLTYIVDRAKDMINRGGENVYCVEVENAMAGAPGVAEAAVIGVPDEVMGEKVGAVVVAAPGTEIDSQAVVEYLKGRLADFKVPQYLAIRSDPLPRNPGGKVLKPVLRRETTWGSPLR